MISPDGIASTDEKHAEAPSSSNTNRGDGPHTTARDDGFVDRTISTKDWASRTFENTPGQLKDYFFSLFPIATWIYRYNLTWMTGDVCSRA